MTFRYVTLNESQRDGSFLRLSRFDNPVVPSIEGRCFAVLAEHWRCEETRLVLTRHDAERLRDWLNEVYPITDHVAEL